MMRNIPGSIARLWDGLCRHFAARGVTLGIDKEGGGFVLTSEDGSSTQTLDGVLEQVQATPQEPESEQKQKRG
jgi:hypothetical protein